GTMRAREEPVPVDRVVLDRDCAVVGVKYSKPNGRRSRRRRPCPCLGCLRPRSPTSTAPWPPPLLYPPRVCPDRALRRRAPHPRPPATRTAWSAAATSATRSTPAP